MSGTPNRAERRRLDLQFKKCHRKEEKKMMKAAPNAHQYNAKKSCKIVNKRINVLSAEEKPAPKPKPSKIKATHATAMGEIVAAMLRGRRLIARTVYDSINSWSTNAEPVNANTPALAVTIDDVVISVIATVIKDALLETDFNAMYVMGKILDILDGIIGGPLKKISGGSQHDDDVVLNNVTWELEKLIAKALKKATDDIYDICLEDQSFFAGKNDWFFDTFAEDFIQVYYEKYNQIYYNLNIQGGSYPTEEYEGSAYTEELEDDEDEYADNEYTNEDYYRNDEEENMTEEYDYKEEYDDSEILDEADQTYSNKSDTFSVTGHSNQNDLSEPARNDLEEIDQDVSDKADTIGKSGEAGVVSKHDSFSEVQDGEGYIEDGGGIEKDIKPENNNESSTQELQVDDSFKPAYLREPEQMPNAGCKEEGERLKIESYYEIKAQAAVGSEEDGESLKNENDDDTTDKLETEYDEVGGELQSAQDNKPEFHAAAGEEHNQSFKHEVSSEVEHDTDTKDDTAITKGIQSDDTKKHEAITKRCAGDSKKDLLHTKNEGTDNNEEEAVDTKNSTADNKQEEVDTKEEEAGTKEEEVDTNNGEAHIAEEKIATKEEKMTTTDEGVGNNKGEIHTKKDIDIKKTEADMKEGELVAKEKEAGNKQDETDTKEDDMVSKNDEIDAKEGESSATLEHENGGEVAYEQRAEELDELDAAIIDSLCKIGTLSEMITSANALMCETNNVPFEVEQKESHQVQIK